MNGVYPSGDAIRLCGMVHTINLKGCSRRQSTQVSSSNKPKLLKPRPQKVPLLQERFWSFLHTIKTYLAPSSHYAQGNSHIYINRPFTPRKCWQTYQQMVLNSHPEPDPAVIYTCYFYVCMQHNAMQFYEYMDYHMNKI